MDAKAPYYTNDMILAAQAGDLEARNELVIRSMGLIHRFVAMVVGADNVPEYLGAGARGFMQAVAKFDVSAGTQLSSYASRSIMRMVAHQRRREEWQQRRRTFVSIEDFARPDGTPVVIEEPSAEYEPIEPDQDCARLLACVVALPDRLRAVIVGRMRGDTLRTLGAALGVSKERIRQLEIDGREKLVKMMQGADPAP